MRLGFTCIIFLICVQSKAQKFEFDNPDWLVVAENHELGLKDGVRSIKLTDGTATLENLNFVNGEVEFDMFFSNEMSFPGFMFRMQDSNNFEEFYLRPWLSGNIDSSQYSPVYNGISGWQLYHGEPYSKELEFGFDQWVHFKFVVNDDLLEVYMGEAKKPHVTIRLKQPVRQGKLGIKNAFAPVYFANFKVFKSDESKIIGRPKEEKTSENGTIKRWEISKPFSETYVEGRTELPESFKFNSFEHVESEKTGILNIAKHIDRSPGTDSAYLRINIESNEEQTIPFQFGFSDRVRVFLNGVLLFYANDAWRTRDYKFLGTIGLHDMLYLHLKKGNNELVLAISESFGGWGAIGRFPNSGNITY